MATIIRRERRRPRGLPLWPLIGAGVLTGVVVLTVLAWQRGGPQPLHEIVVPVRLGNAQVEIRW